MFSRTAQIFVPQCTQVRGMATLKDIRLRLKSVTNIQKITKSMKMVSAAKYAKAERELKPAKPYGEQASAMTENMKPKEDEQTEMIIALTSDRGLCGSVHSAVVKAIKARLADKGAEANVKLVLVGDKSKAMLQKLYGKHVVCSFNEIGKQPPVFQDASLIANEAIGSGLQDASKVTMYYNVFKSVVAFNTRKMDLLPEAVMKGAENYPLYDSLDDETLRCYNEFCLASTLYYGLKEAQCSEQSSRMTAMDSASKNAGEMIDKLTLTFNRTRQAVITRELIEIISGAAAL